MPRTREAVMVDRSLVGERPSTTGLLALRAGDDGMAGAGVFRDDVVVVDEERAPRVGEWVALLVESRVVVRAVDRSGSVQVFRPTTPKYEPRSRADPSVYLIGTVLASIRRAPSLEPGSS